MSKSVIFLKVNDKEKLKIIVLIRIKLRMKF